jgi:hydrogenase maturation factor
MSNPKKPVSFKPGVPTPSDVEALFRAECGGLKQEDFCQRYVLARAGCLLSNMNGPQEAEHAMAAWKKILAATEGGK